jgi:hypothetical protein
MIASSQDTRAIVAFGLLFINVAPAVPQERAPNGAIYRELVPFVNLNGVRLEIHGGGGFIWNFRPPAPADPAVEITGLSRTERDRLFEAIKVEATESLRLAGIPLVEPGVSSDTPPRLVISVNTHRFRPDAISADVTLELLQAARLLSDPGTVVWSSTWANKTSNLTADSAALTAWVRGATRGQVKTFVELYGRAHRKAG